MHSVQINNGSTAYPAVLNVNGRPTKIQTISVNQLGQLNQLNQLHRINGMAGGVGGGRQQYAILQPNNGLNAGNSMMAFAVVPKQQLGRGVPMLVQPNQLGQLQPMNQMNQFQLNRLQQVQIGNIGNINNITTINSPQNINRVININANINVPNAGDVPELVDIPELVNAPSNTTSCSPGLTRGASSNVLSLPALPTNLLRRR